MRYIGVGTSIIAKFWALPDGLILASHLGINQLLVELDAKVIVDLFLSKKPSNKSYSSMFIDYRYLLGQFHRIKISHVYRDFVAPHPGNFVVLDAPPTDELCVILNSNASGLYSLRLLATASPFMAR